MFGFYRFFLAITVSLGHLVGPSWIGVYAVFGFYVLSGYLMTMIMQKTYHYTIFGRIRFGINRFLRLYPLYWIACLISVLLISAFGAEAVYRYHRVITIPETIGTLFSNITMMFPAWEPITYSPRLVPPTWALTIEILNYFLICIGFSQTLKRTLLWFALSLVYLFYTVFSGSSWETRFYPIVAGCLPYSMGALIYFAKTDGNRFFLLIVKHVSAKFLVLLFIASTVSVSVLFRHFSDVRILEAGFYVSLIVNVLLVAVLCVKDPPDRVKRIDKELGDYSYPIYLLHWQFGFLASTLIVGYGYHGFSKLGCFTFLVSLLLLMPCAKLINFAIDKKINPLRKKIKSSAVGLS